MTAMDNLAFKIDQLWSGSKIAEIIDRIRDQEGYDESALKSVLVNTFLTAEEALQDGFQIMDVAPVLAAGLKDVMLLAESLKGATGEDKLAFVTEMFTALYNFIDKGVDGDKNRIDIPWIPQVAEDFIEQRVLPVVIRFGVEAVVAIWNKDK